MSKQNNLTTVFGRLTPILCQPVMPGDSIRIQPNFGLRYMPQVFPTQTRQRASVKYYYVRNRNLWKDWPDFIGKNKQGLVPPYLQFAELDNKLLRPSSLADYMGFPIHIKPSARGRNQLKAAQPIFVQGQGYAYLPNSSTVLSAKKGDPFSIRTFRNLRTVLGVPSNNQGNRWVPLNWLYGGSAPAYAVNMPLYVDSSLPIGAALSPVTFNYESIYLNLYRKALKPSGDVVVSVYPPMLDDGAVFVICRDVTGIDYVKRLTTSSTTLNFVGNDPAMELQGDSVANTNVNIESIVGVIYATNTPSISSYTPQITMSINLQLNEDICWCDVDYTDMPFASVAKPEGLRMSALPFRAVESVYNALVRNAENNPLIINGVPEYNRYIQSDAGGAQRASQILESYPANWADDRFTTALPSPQQGNAPLVGLTGNVGATFNIGNADGSNTQIRLEVDSQTGNVVGVDVGSSTANEDNISEMWNAVDYGISIADLRNVNAYQRWKENNVRGGYKYKDQISTHYGVNVRFDVLDMPEFIGGCSRDVDVRQVTQTVENEYGNLGDYAGQSFVTGEGKAIEHYCDEHGFIIGLLSVYPMPIYTDTLPKYWLANDPFDYFFPEFGKIGPQPIKKMELAFSQSYLEDQQNDTFGYQRGWYDLLENLDEVHGLFQSDLKNFIISREFAQTPTLGSDFLTIDSEDLNNTFYVEDDSDKIIGEIYHDMSMKRPVPLRGIPAIE